MSTRYCSSLPLTANRRTSVDRDHTKAIGLFSNFRNPVALVLLLLFGCALGGAAASAIHIPPIVFMPIGGVIGFLLWLLFAHAFITVAVPFTPLHVSNGYMSNPSPGQRLHRNRVLWQWIGDARAWQGGRGPLGQRRVHDAREQANADYNETDLGVPAVNISDVEFTRCFFFKCGRSRVYMTEHGLHVQTRRGCTKYARMHSFIDYIVPYSAVSWVRVGKTGRQLSELVYSVMAGLMLMAVSMLCTTPDPSAAQPAGGVQVIDMIWLFASFAVGLVLWWDSNRVGLSVGVKNGFDIDTLLDIPMSNCEATSKQLLQCVLPDSLAGVEEQARHRFDGVGLAADTRAELSFSDNVLTHMQEPSSCCRRACCGGPQWFTSAALRDAASITLDRRTIRCCGCCAPKVLAVAVPGPAMSSLAGVGGFMLNFMPEFISATAGQLALLYAYTPFAVMPIVSEISSTELLQITELMQRSRQTSCLRRAEGP